MANRKWQKGFTLLELVISVLVIAILYGVLSTRLGRVAESAERAAVYGVLGQVRQQLNLRLAKFYIDGSSDKAKALINENPFSWISPPPSQYAGEVSDATEVLIKGRWYFDRVTKQLIYRVKRNNNIKIEGGEQRNLRFVLKLNGKAADTQQKSAVYSIKIQAVKPFVWNIGA
ncbi:type II secretion system protein [Neptunomonas japonica]|uniref:type II secretion system protein n=1 Tax=Neptunomonas japonica TaxID=417574 RepID=UPI00040C7292|nr:type II secretion system protein [Neptunomonas japonica]